MASKERLTTNSRSFGREIETAEVSLYNEILEEDFYIRQKEIIDLFKTNPSEAKKMRMELKKEIRLELEDEMDEQFDRFSLFTELVISIVHAKKHLQEMKKMLVKNGITNFLLEWHPPLENNSSHIQYTGNKSIYADELLVKYINDNELSLHYIEDKKDEMIISDDLDSLLNDLSKTISDASNVFSKQKESGRDRLAKWKANMETKKEEVNNVLSAYNNAKSSRKSRR